MIEIPLRSTIPTTTSMSDDFCICLAFVVLSILYAATSKNIKTVEGPPVTQTKSRRDGFSRDDIQTGVAMARLELSFPTFWWGGIWREATANAIFFRFFSFRPLLSHFLPSLSFFLFSLLFTFPSYPFKRIPILRFPLSLPSSLFEFVYDTIQNNAEYYRNRWQWEMQIRMIVIQIKSYDIMKLNSHTSLF